MKSILTRHRVVAICGSFLIVSCSSSALQVQDSDAPKPHLYIATDVSSPNEVKFASRCLDETKRLARRFGFLSLDRVAGNTVHVHYSNSSDRAAFREFVENELVETPASDAGLIASVQRISTYGQSLEQKGRLTALLLTEGTTSNESIDSLRSVAESIPKNVSLYIVGVSPEHRKSFSRAFNPIRDRARIYGQSDAAISSLIKHLKEQG